MTNGHEDELEKYLHYLDEYDLTYEQKMDWLYTLYGAMSGIVDQAFGLGTTTLAMAANGAQKERTPKERAEQDTLLQELMAEFNIKEE